MHFKDYISDYKRYKGLVIILPFQDLYFSVDMLKMDNI